MMMRLLLLLIVIAPLLSSCIDTPDGEARQARADMGPVEVVRQQVAALARNSELGDDRGIRRAWRFASPANREAIGPLPRFRQLLRNPGYRALLDNRDARYDEPVFRAGRVAVPVTVTTITGRNVDYVFFLSRSEHNECQGCWMTDAVQPRDGQSLDRGPRVSI